MRSFESRGLGARPPAQAGRVLQPVNRVTVCATSPTSPRDWSQEALPHRFPDPRVNRGSDNLQDWRSYRAQLVEMESSSEPATNRALLRRPVSKTAAAGGSWAHLLPAVEPGCLLLAKQDNMQFFNQTVVLITSHDNEKGSMGYVVNKPSPLHVNELQVGGAASAPFKDTFASQRLHLGGPVHLDHVTLLHRFLGISRSHRIAEGIHMGGLPDAVRLVESGLAAPEDFHLVLGMAGWQGRQLTEEVEKGFWHVVAASSDLMLPKKRAPGDKAKANGGQQQLPAADNSMYAKISKLALKRYKS